MVKNEFNLDKNSFMYRLALASVMKHKKNTEIAKDCGIASAQVTQYMSGTCKPRPAVLKKLAEYFDVSEGWLLGYAPLEDMKPYFKEDERVASLCAIFERLNDEAKNALYLVAVSMVNNDTLRR